MFSKLKFFLLLFLCITLVKMNIYAKDNKNHFDIESPSAILIELNSGKVLYEKDANVARKPASVTKLMTMLLTFESLDSGKLKLTDEIVISDHAASMGGSQVFLEPGEVQPVEDLLKCIIVSSANDAAVAMGEAISGSEDSFVDLMNQRAKELGLKQTQFKNACGLEAENHLMSAKDIGILSRELLKKYPEVMNYSTIWMDEITHKTKKGESKFGLANTNKFLKKYNGANGLKTGYTSAAGFSMSATATRNDVTLIAVIMGSKTKDIRYQDAAKLLDYGFASCSVYKDTNVLNNKNLFRIKNGVKNNIKVKSNGIFQSTIIGEYNKKDIHKELELVNNIAPIKKGDLVAKIVYRFNENIIGYIPIIAEENIMKERYYHAFHKIFMKFMGGCEN